MKKLIYIVLLFVCLKSFSQTGFYDTPDAKLHTKTSFVISNLTYLVAVETLDFTPSEGILLSTGFDLLSVGFKEIVLDGRFDWKDMGHNFIGIAAGKLTMYLFQTFVRKDSKSYKYRNSRKSSTKTAFISLELNGKKLQS